MLLYSQLSTARTCMLSNTIQCTVSVGLCEPGEHGQLQKPEQQQAKQTL
jgi:hypothetical protein